MGMAIALHCEGSGEQVDLDKIWHVVHYALTGTAGETDHPLGFLMGGGEAPEGEEEFFDEMGGGYFDSAACTRIAKAFDALDEATMEARLNSPQAAAADLYCWPVGPDEVIPAAHELAGFFQRAAKAGSGAMVMMY